MFLRHVYDEFIIFSNLKIGEIAPENLGVWKQIALSEIMFIHCQGQLVSKGLFAILNSSKKERKKSTLLID